MGDKSIACKECIFGNHERKTCYLESDCETMHEWLRKHDEEVRNKAIDDFRKKICEKYTEEERKENYKQYCCNIKQELVDLAEQLKAKQLK